MPRRRPSIAMPIFLLVILSVTLAALVMFAVTFRGPPPQGDPLRLAQLAIALDGGALPQSGRKLERVEQDGEPTPPPSDHEIPASRAALAQALRLPESQVRLWAMQPQRLPDEVRGPFVAARRIATGWRVIRIAPPPFFTHWHRISLTAMAIALLLLGGLGWALAQAISRPIRRLGVAAAQSRLGRPVAIPRGGPREVDQLAASIATMQDRMVRTAEGRNAMFVAITHDLGTPLSRVAFWIEQLPEPARTRAAADLDEMRTMLQSVLRFSRDERTGETRVRVEIGSLIESLAEDMASAGQDVTATPGPRAVVRGDPAALRRMFANLIENAVRYGEGAAMRWTLTENEVELWIDDSGPGFDPETADALFTAFVRGDPSRNRATGGTGLGLAIVRAIADAHGGGVELTNHARGGRVIVRLPLA
ncbi:HAMP domain-containing sensor histidine kinase [Sphingomonas sp.]|uniref:sensor histidine kinase n=1 Tax=Sphingomonas sp. TaxID=28214 RepID=UPI001ECEBA3C|nr:HAMP domain-containing sensor histidine kinase [Sphingomonas sp.]MBX3594732.1 HAMP domain-containing histidine kinase [Sphingomonas sp.]